MTDTKLKSLSEVALNICVGFLINFCINSLTFPYFGIPFDLHVYLLIGGLYTITSLIIQYPVRRAFARISNHQSIKGSIYETILNYVLSWIFTFITGLLVLPIFGMTSTVSITIINTLGSITTMIRRFLFRRLFNHFGEKENLYTLTLRLCKHLNTKFASCKRF